MYCTYLNISQKFLSGPARHWLSPHLHLYLTVYFALSHIIPVLLQNQRRRIEQKMERTKKRLKELQEERDGQCFHYLCCGRTVIDRRLGLRDNLVAVGVGVLAFGS